tara:strand:+ start:28614 stop:28946 length:333 start_codon:yes stop_codon:yes gene_type:complete
MKYLIYDDECNFCCKVVMILTPLVDKSVIKYISLRSQKAKELIDLYDLKNINSVIYFDGEDKIYIKAIAVLKVFNLMNFPYKLLYLFNILPKSFLNFVYDFIARNRMRLK